MSGFLTGVVSIVDNNGDRVDTPNADGDHSPVELQLGTSILATKSTNGSLTRVKIEALASGGVVIAADTHDDFRVLDPANVPDGTVIHFKNPVGVYVYETSFGAGELDDDNSVLKLNLISDGANARAYSVDQPILPTIASLRLAVSGKWGTVQVQAFATAGDGGGGIFDKRAGTLTDDGGVQIQPGGATFHYVRRYSGALHAAWFGVRGDGKFLTDGVTTAGSPIFASASAGFASADTGKKILARTPNAIASGTVTSSGATLSGTSTHVASDMPIIVDKGGGIGQPLSGGCIYCDGQFLVVSFVLTATEQLQLRNSPSPSISGKPYYTETQLPASLTYASSTTMTMSANATISQTGVHAFYATDCTTALDNAIKACFALGVTELILPAGYIGVSANLGYVDKSHLTIRGPGMNKCCLVDLRRASTYYTTGPNGMLSFSGSSDVSRADDVHLVDFSYDGSVPVLGMVHSSTPGVDNGSGRRIGFWMQHMTNSSYRLGGGIVVGDGRYGARDEHAYVDGQSDDFTFDHCNIVGTNNVSINCNGGFNGAGNPQPERLKILSPRATGILVSASTYLMDTPDVSPGGVDIEGDITVDKIGHGIINAPFLHDFTLFQGVGLIESFGNTRTDSSLTILNPVFARNVGNFQTGGGALIHLNGFGGICKIIGLVDKENTGLAANGRVVLVEGAATGKITIEQSGIEGGSNLTIGVQVAAGVPQGAVVEGAGIRYGSSIATRWKIDNAGISTLREMVAA